MNIIDDDVLDGACDLLVKEYMLAEKNKLIFCNEFLIVSKDKITRIREEKNKIEGQDKEKNEKNEFLDEIRKHEEKINALTIWQNDGYSVLSSKKKLLKDNLL